MTSGARPARAAPGEALRVVFLLWASLGAIAPLLSRGLQGGTHDGLTHLYRLLDFDQTFRSGVWFPRVAPHLALDYGYATFAYYSPGVLYVDEAFRLAGLGSIASVKASFATGILIGALGLYLLARDLYGWRGALVAALCYAYLPYRLLDVYTRGDLSETLGLGALPWVFWSFHRLLSKRDPSRLVVAGLSLATLITLHNLTALFAIPVLAGFLLASLIGQSEPLTRELAEPSPGPRWLVWLVSFGRQLGPAALSAGLAGILALALSAAYWLPTLVELKTLNTSSLTTGYFDYHKWFVPLDQLVQRPWAYDYRFALELGARFNLGRTQIALALLALLWVLLVRPTSRHVLWYASAGIILLIWMQHRSSAFVWDHLPVARFLQFPYRLSGYIGLLSSLLTGSFLAPCCETPASAWRRSDRPSHPPPRLDDVTDDLTPSWPRPLAVAPRARALASTVGIAATIAYITASLASLPRGHVPLQEFEVNLPTLWRVEFDRGLISGTARGDYLPGAVRGNFFRLASSGLHPTNGVAEAVLTAIASGPLSLEAISDARSPATVIFDRLTYPGWQATIDGQPVPVRAYGPLAELSLRVPAGRHRLTLTDSGDALDHASLAVTLVALLAALALLIRPRDRRWPVRLALLVILLIATWATVARSTRPPRELAGGFDFGQSVRLVGARVDQVPSAQTGAVTVTLLWEALRSPLPNCTVHLRLLDNRGSVVATRDKPPLFGLRPCSQWQAGEIVRDLEQIRLPPGTRPGQYRLGVALTLDDQAYPASVVPAAPAAGRRRAAGQVTTSVILGSVDATPGPPVATLPDARPIGAVLGGRFTLAAARVYVPSAAEPTTDTSSVHRFIARLHPGDRLQIDLLWHSLRDVSRDYAVFTHLLDARHHLIAQDDSWPDQAGYPTSVWFPGDTLVDHHQIETPPAIPPGVYTLSVGMYPRPMLQPLPVTGRFAHGQEVLLGTVKISDSRQIFGEPVPVQSQRIVLGGEIELDGAKVIARDPQPGGLIHTDLEWRALVRPTANDTVFVHLLDSAGQLVAQHDGPPLDGAYPTTDWDPGDVVFERIPLALPPHLPAGRFTVEVGLYHRETGVRLAAPTGQTSFPVGSVAIQDCGEEMASAGHRAAVAALCPASSPKSPPI